MALVKCRYTKAMCRNGYSPYEDCECECWQEDKYVLCSFAELTEEYLEGDFKKVSFKDGILRINGRVIAERRGLTTGEMMRFSGMDFLEIDGHVYVDDENKGVHSSG